MHVHLPVAHLAQAAEALLLEDLQQLGLDLRVEVPDLVEEHHAAVRHLEQALLARHGAGVGPLLVAEELRLEEVAVEARAVHVDERLVGAGTVAVQPAGEDALAGAGLALDQDRAARGHDPPRLLGEGPNGGRGPGEGVHRLAGLARAPGDLAPLLALALEQPLHHDEEGRQLHRLGQELVGALLDRAHGQVDRGVPGEHHHRQRRVDLAQARQEVEGRSVGQHVVEDDRVGVPVAHEPLGRGDGLRLLDLEALALEEVPDPEADPGLVVDDQDLRQGFSRTRARRLSHGGRTASRAGPGLSSAGGR